MSSLALVTGASSGIGQAFAERLARDGHDLIVVGRRRDRLEALATALNGVEVQVVIADLSTDDGIDTVAEICELEPLTMLVNNAGVAHYMPMAELPASKARELVHVKVVAPTMLTRAALPGMLERANGTVVNVAGMIAFAGPAPASQMPRRAVYAGTLANIVAMTQTLHAELEGTGVQAHVVCPGIVATEFHTVQGMDLSAVPRMSAADVVTAALAGIALGEVVSAPGVDDYSLLETVFGADLAAFAGPEPAARNSVPSAGDAMTQPLEGVRILEVDNWGFAPSAGAVLADWGADIVKVEPPGRGDPLRSIFGALNFAPGAMFNFMYEQWNRNKRSIALDLTTTGGRAVLDELIESSDVFLTNYLPDLRAKLRLTADDVRAVKPDIVYALATGQGSKGPDSAKPSYDYVSAWARAGVGERLTPEAAPFIQQRAGIVDTSAGNFLAGAIAAALLRRERTREPVDVEVSLLAAGGWIVGPDIAFALNNDFEMPHNRPDGRGAGPLFTWYECADGRRLVFTMMQPERYWPEVARVLELDEVLTDEQFDTPEKRMAETDALCAVLAERIRSKPRDEWAERLNTADVIWGPVQSPNEFVDDVQVVANGYIVDAPKLDGSTTRLMASPAQFDHDPIAARWAAPDIGQHTDEVLEELGWSADRIIAAKAAGFVA